MNTQEIIRQVSKANLTKAINICKAKGGGDFVKGLDIIKKKYDERPFDLAWADLKTVIEVIEGALNNDVDYSNKIVGVKCDKVIIDELI